jgi:hypothetical protein
MIIPVNLRCRLRNNDEDLILFPSGPASRITIKSAQVFNSTDIVPRTINCRNTCPAFRLTNGGRKERKKRPVFGFRTSVATPYRKELRAGDVITPTGSSQVGSSIIRTPR